MLTWQVGRVKITRVVEIDGSWFVWDDPMETEGW